MALQERQVLEPPPGSPPARPSSARPPLFCWAVIAGSVAMFLLDRVLPWRVVEIDGAALPIAPGALYGPLVRQGEYWRVLWSVLEHGGPLHLLLNMSVVWTLGQALERAIKTWRFALISIITALGSATFALAFPGELELPTVGASGMILGWAGAMLPISTQQGRRSLTTWLVQIAVISLLPGISWQAHLGGFLFGLPCGWALRGGAERFRYVAPVILFLSAVVTVLVGSGHLRFHE